MAKVVMPQLGESVAEGTIGKWLKQPGDHVAKDEPLLEVITDKVNAEVPSPFEGTLEKILVEEGATVPHDAEIAVIAEAGAAGGAPASSTPSPNGEAATSGPKPAAEVSGSTVSAASGATVDEPETSPERGSGGMVPVMETAAERMASGATANGGSRAAATGQTGDGDPNARMTPAVRMLMREHGLTPDQIVGTGHGGRITRDDVLAFVSGAASAGGATARGASAGAGAAQAAQPAVSQSAAPAQAQAPAPSAPAAPAGPSAPAAPAGPSAAPAASSPAPAPSAARAPSAAPAPSMPAPSAAAPIATSVPASGQAAWEPGQDELLVPLNQMRRGIANQMTRAAAVPVAYSTFESDVTGIANLREAQGAGYKAREGVGLSYLPFVIKAVVEALHGHPDLNAHYTDEGILRKRHINIGVAIAVDNGLIVPVIKDADGLSIAGLNRAIQDLSSRARSNRLRLDDLQGGTFTVDNTGWFGSQLTVPILNVPEVVILTTEAVTKRPVVRETPDGDVIAVRSMMNLVAGYDHRATDGAQIGRFVKDVICWLEAVGPDMPIY